MIFLYILLAALVLVLATSLICFLKIFYTSRREKWPEYPVPAGEIYEPHHEQMIEWIKYARALPHKEVSIQSFDGLTLRGTYFEFEKGLPIDILFHGYHGCAEQDLSGGVYRCQRLGHNVLIVDHRASGKSEGHVITFGVNESRDCADWTKFIAEHIDPDAPIFLGGVSMGAATALMATARDLHPNVVGVLADCGYSSTERIIKKVIGEMHLPPDLCYPFVKLGARIYGHFDLEEISPEEAMKTCKLPVIFLHGDADAFVPHQMSVENFEACASEHKKLVTIEGAGHGVAFPAAQERYVREVRDFFDGALKDKE